MVRSWLKFWPCGMPYRAILSPVLYAFCCSLRCSSCLPWFPVAHVGLYSSRQRPGIAVGRLTVAKQGVRGLNLYFSTGRGAGWDLCKTSENMWLTAPLTWWVLSYIAAGVWITSSLAYCVMSGNVTAISSLTELHWFRNKISIFFQGSAPSPRTRESLRRPNPISPQLIWDPLLRLWQLMLQYVMLCSVCVIQLQNW